MGREPIGHTTGKGTDTPASAPGGGGRTGARPAGDGAAGHRAGGGLSLFCLAHAGGSAGPFLMWSRWLPAAVRPVPLELPGHGARRREPLATSWPQLVDDVAGRVAGRPDGGGYALLGHSLGALVGFEVARTLHRAGDPPLLLIVAGRNAPAAGLSHRPIHQLADGPFLEALGRLGGTPEAFRQEPDLVRAVLPALRTDLRLAETYARPPGPPLPCPISAYAGRDDRLTDPGDVLGWYRETTAHFDLTIIDAGHFFLDRPEFRSALGARLLRLDGYPPATPGPAGGCLPGAGAERPVPPTAAGPPTAVAGVSRG